MTTLTSDQVKAIREAQEKLKALAELQTKEKAILRQPHCKAVYTRGDMKWEGISAAGILQSRTALRANDISTLLIEYNKMRGKEWHMHERKKK